MLHNLKKQCCWEAGRLEGWEAGRLGGWEAGRLGGYKAKK